MARKHTLVIGERGVGKTTLINDFLDTQGKIKIIPLIYIYYLIIIALKKIRMEKGVFSLLASPKS